MRPSAGRLLPLSVRTNPNHKHFVQPYILPWNGQLTDLKFSDLEVEKVKWLTLGELESEMAAGKFMSKKVNEEIKSCLKNNL